MKRRSLHDLVEPTALDIGRMRRQQAISADEIDDSSAVSARRLRTGGRGAG